MNELKGSLLISTFTAGSLRLAVDALVVQEIIRVPVRTQVYLAPPGVWGVINLRGRIVTVWDLRVFMGEEELSLGDDCRVIVLKFQEESVGMLVDGVDDVLEVRRDQIQTTPGNVDQKNARYIQGVIGDGERLISLLDLESIEAEIKG